MAVSSSAQGVENGPQMNRLMKVSRRGRTFSKDTHDLFATLMVSLRFDTNRQFFKSFDYTFTTDAAAINLSNLKFAQSQRSPDPKDPSRILTTTTTTTFSMTRDMAKSICQQFMDAHLIANAADPSSTSFKDRSLYSITPKGLHILERFISKNGIAADHLMNVFATQPIAMKLLHLERRLVDDEVIINKSVIEVLFRRFAGRQPNLPKFGDDKTNGKTSHSNSSQPSLHDDVDLSQGVAVRKQPNDTSDKAPQAGSTEYVFSAPAAVAWLIDYTTIGCVDEAAEIAAHFVRYGLIRVVQDKSVRFLDPMRTAEAIGGSATAGGGAGAKMTAAEFRYGEKVLYRVTTEGAQCARWENGKATGKPHYLHASTLANGGGRVSTESVPTTSDPSSVADQLRMDYLDIKDSNGSSPDIAAHHRDSHTVKLRQILEEPVLRSLFREFLRGDYCDENLAFWLDCQDFKRRFNTTSSASSANDDSSGGGSGKKTRGLGTMEKHQHDILAMAFLIYNTYLAPASPSEINIDHNLREELLAYMSKLAAEVKAKEGLSTSSSEPLDPAIAAKALHASQVQTMVKLYERIQGYIFRLMATDSVPKFCKTERYIEAMRANAHLSDPDRIGAYMEGMDKTVGEGGSSSNDDALEGTKAYVTISQAANEKQAALLKQQQRSCLRLY